MVSRLHEQLSDRDSRRAHVCASVCVCTCAVRKRGETCTVVVHTCMCVCVCVCVSVVIDFGFIAGSRAVLYLGPNQSVSLTASRDLPAGGVCVCVCVCMCVCAKERERERERGSLKGGAADGCAEQNGLLGAGSTPPSRFQCPRLSLTGHSQGDLLFYNTHLHRYTHRHTHTCTDNAIVKKYYNIIQTD